MAWNDLSINQKSQLMNIFRRNGVTSLVDMKRIYDSTYPSLDNTGVNQLPMLSENKFVDGGIGNLHKSGGGIHIDPSKKGTFKAQATRMGMSVKQAASHILTHKEDYSPAMRKKANFAKNFAATGGPQERTEDNNTNSSIFDSRKVDLKAWAKGKHNRGREVPVKALEQLQDSLIARKYPMPQRLAILGTSAQEMNWRGAASKGIGGNGYLGYSSSRMPVSYLDDSVQGRGDQIHFLLNDLETTHSNNWLDGGAGGPVIMTGQDGYDMFWNSDDIGEATVVLNKSNIRPAGREDAWNNRAGVAISMEPYLKPLGGRIYKKKR